MSEEIKDPQLVDETKLPEEETNCQSNTSPNAEGEELADTTPDALSSEEQLQSELDKLKEIVLDKDERAFVTINAVHDIVGGRFKKKAIH